MLGQPTTRFHNYISSTTPTFFVPVAHAPDRPSTTVPTDSSLTASPPPSFLLLFNYKPAYSVSITQPCSHWTFAVHPRTDGPATPGRPTAWRGATLKPRSTPASPWPYICMPHFFASAAAAQPAAPSVQSMTGKSMTKVLPTWSRSEVWGGRTLHTAQHTTGAAYRPLRPGCLPLPAAHSLLMTDPDTHLESSSTWCNWCRRADGEV